MRIVCFVFIVKRTVNLFIYLSIVIIVLNSKAKNFVRDNSEKRIWLKLKF